MRPKLVDNATWTRKAGRDLRFEEQIHAEKPVGPADSRAARIADLEDELPTRVVWHATDNGGIDAPIHDWQPTAITAANCGQSWPHGSGYYLLYHEDREVPDLCTHYRMPGDREDPRPNNGPNNPDAEFRRFQAEMWGRARSEANDKQAEIDRLRADLASSQRTVSTHLETIAKKDQRIAALEGDRVPAEHWASPVMDQLGGFLREIRPYAGPALRDAAPFVRAAVQEHLSGGVYTAGLLERLEQACASYDRLLGNVAEVADIPEGFGLRIPPPTDEAILSHHCPLAACAAEAAEPCLDEAGHPTDPHEERRALARVPREARAALRKCQIEIVPLSAIVRPPGAVVASDESVLKAARELETVLEMDAWRARHQTPESEPAALGSDPEPEPEPEPEPPAAPAAPAAAAPTRDEIPDAELDEAPAPAPAPRHHVKLETSDARADFAARVAERAIPLAESPEVRERTARLAEARRVARARAEEMEKRRADLEAERAAAKNNEEPKP